jgi:adenylate kinase family enzyme
MKRVVVVGIPGAGKSTLARWIAQRYDLPFHELDGFVEGPGWTQLPDYRERIADMVAGDRWVTDGLLYPEGVEQLLLSRADTVVWLDLPRGLVVRRLVRRTLRRGLPPRPVLVNGNKEHLWAVLLPDSPLRTAWRDHASYQERIGAALSATDARVVHLRDAAEVVTWTTGQGTDPPQGT